MLNEKYEIQQFITQTLCDISISSFICHPSGAGEVEFVVQPQL